MTNRVVISGFPKSNYLPPHKPEVRDVYWQKAVTGHNHKKINFKDNITVVSKNMPNCTVQHTGWVSYLYCCWRDEVGASLRPDILAGIVLSILAGEICKDPKTYQHLFTTSTEKTRFVVGGPEDEISIDALIQCLQSTIADKEVADLFLTSFESQPANYDRYSKMCLLQAGTPFFDYSATRCGIRGLEILGSLDDWKKLEAMLKTIQAKFGPLSDHIGDWMTKALKSLEKIIQAVMGDTTSHAYMQNMFYIKQNCGSGHIYYCQGWFADFYLKRSSLIEEFAEGLVFVPYDDLETQKMWAYVSGLTFSTKENIDGNDFYRPDYGSVKCQILQREDFSIIAQRPN